MTATQLEALRQSATRLEMVIQGAHSATIKNLRQGIVELELGHMDRADECFRFAGEMAAFQDRELNEWHRKLRGGQAALEETSVRIGLNTALRSFARSKQAAPVR